MPGGRLSSRAVIALVAAAAVVVGGVSAGAVTLVGHSSRPAAAPLPRRSVAARPHNAAAGVVPAAPVRAAPGPATGTAPTVSPSPAPAAAPTDLPLPGCPPPPYTGPRAQPPWHPAHLVPDSQVPAPPPARPGRNPVSAISGKGMWIWQVAATDHGSTAAVVSDAASAGLHQIWVRVGDSPDGFYGAAALGALVPAAHRRGIAVIGWGFPYLFDPAADAAWTEAAIGWRAPGGDRLDGFSADIETSSEGVALSPQRAASYLGLVRHADPTTLLVATVFPPTDHEMATYPYAAMAPYVDAYAPMVYWGCSQPVLGVDQALARLGPLAPVHVIGQAYDMGPYGGRRGAPLPAELDAFMLAAERGGAAGASFWSWQSIDPADWSAVARFSW